MESSSSKRLDDRAAAEALAGIEKFIVLIVRQRLPVRFKGDAADVAQEIRLKLWTTALPRFDPSRGAKLSTYLCRCSINALHDEIRKLERRHEFTTLPYYIEAPAITPGLDELADDSQTNPDDYLPPRAAELMRLLVADAPLETIAAALAVKNQKSVDNARTRLRERVRDLARRCA